MATKTLFMETTQIPSLKTAGEITELLVRAGAAQIAMDYSGQKIVGLMFSVPVSGRVEPYCYKLPVRVDPVFRLLNGRRPESHWKRGNRKEWADRDRDQAERVAWRQLLRWIQAQLAMIETGMAEILEVFLPYMQAQDGRTMFQLFHDHELKMLEAPAKED